MHISPVKTELQKPDLTKYNTFKKMDTSMESIDTPMVATESNEASTTPNERKEIVLDSLPYIDQVHPDYEAYALTLIEEEMQKNAATPTFILRRQLNTSLQIQQAPNEQNILRRTRSKKWATA